MKTNPIFGVLSIFFISLACNGEKEEGPESLMIKYKAKEIADSIINKSRHDALFDTVGLSEAPVKVISAKVIEDNYSTYKSVLLKYQNVSGKSIAGIKFKWYGVNVFNEAADLGSNVAIGFGAGFTDVVLEVGKTQTYKWELLSRDAKKISLAWPYEVIFQDESKWKIGK